MADQHPGEDLLIALALSDLDEHEHERDEVTRHLAACDPCRSVYTALADSVDHVLAAAPSVAPPPGFSSAVLAAMGMGEADDGARVHPTSGSDARRSGNGDSGDDGVEGTASGAQRRLARSLDGASSVGGRRRRGLGLALVASVALLAGAVGAVAVLENRREAATQAVAADGPALLTADGSRVGTVLESRFEGAPVLVVTLTDGRVGVRYECQLVLADGTREAAGSWLVEVPAVTWIVSRPDGAADVAAVELVTPSGAVWATAAL